MTMIVERFLAATWLCFEHNKAADAAKGFFFEDRVFKVNWQKI